MLRRPKMLMMTKMTDKQRTTMTMMIVMIGRNHTTNKTELH